MDEKIEKKYVTQPLTANSGAEKKRLAFPGNETKRSFKKASESSQLHASRGGVPGKKEGSLTDVDALHMENTERSFDRHPKLERQTGRYGRDRTMGKKNSRSWGLAGGLSKKEYSSKSIVGAHARHPE